MPARLLPPSCRAVHFRAGGPLYRHCLLYTSGQTATLGAAEGCVGLPTVEEHWRFNTFTVEEYNALFEKVKSGEIEISNATDVAPEVTNSTVDYQN